MKIVAHLGYINTEYLIEFLRLKGFNCGKYARGVVENTGKGIFKRLGDKKYLPDTPYYYKKTIKEIKTEIVLHDDCILYSKNKLPKTLNNSNLSSTERSMLSGGNSFGSCDGSFSANYSIPPNMGMIIWDETTGWQLLGIIPLNDPELISFINKKYTIEQQQDRDQYVPFVDDIDDNHWLVKCGYAPKEDQLV